jgi:hypothetical protein
MGFLYVLHAEPGWVDERAEYRDAFTDTVPREWRVPQLDLCFLVAAGGGISHACLINRGEMVATFKRRVRFSDIVSLGPSPLSLDEIALDMPANLFPHVRARWTRGGLVPPRTWAALVDTIKRLAPAATSEIDRLIALAREPMPAFRGRGAEILALERDALGLALMAADIDRGALLTWEEPPSPATFLYGLRLRAPIEDRLIDYDASVFGSWDLVRRDASGVTVFEEAGNRLTVINVNRTDIEHALGVDLVYYNHRFGSFILVQYKRMRRESGGHVYRPDQRLEAELQRMRQLPVSRDPSEDPDQYRLHPGSCYLKLCPDGEFRPRDGELIRGMYLPIDFYDELVASDALVGPRNAPRVSFDSAGRHLNSSFFAMLVRDGWIGSRVESTEMLQAVIDELLNEGHSVTLAEHTRAQ